MSDTKIKKTIPFMIRMAINKFPSINTGGWVMLDNGKSRVTSIQSVKILNDGGMIEVVGRCKSNE